LDDPQFKARRYLDKTEHPDAGAHTHPGLPFKLSKAEVSMGRRAPMYAEHSDWVLEDLLCRAEGDIAELRQNNTTPLAPVDRRY
ncbi:MAG: CoA transferase, partial [SAR202 cluster bacterium]|nr:CoA transferase [SAR202 cluster bacterium]